jgi:predicted hotdog family 3-hydroxylacyl-ACP dehydratase
MKKRYPPVAELVPHRPPMILIDEILDIGEKSLSARVALTELSPFVEEGKLPALVTLEYMAQSIAAFAGAARRAAGKPVQLGFLIACREMELEVDSLFIGDVLEVTVNQVWTDEQLGSFDCLVTRRGEKISRASLSVYQGDLSPEGAG